MSWCDTLYKFQFSGNAYRHIFKRHMSKSSLFQIVYLVHGSELAKKTSARHWNETFSWLERAHSLHNLEILFIRKETEWEKERKREVCKNHYWLIRFCVNLVCVNQLTKCYLPVETVTKGEKNDDSNIHSNLLHIQFTRKLF